MTTTPHGFSEIDESVLDRAREGDQEAFAALIRHYDPGLCALAYRLLGSRERMDAALQETYVRAFTAVPRFRRRSRVGAWLYGIAYGVCAEELQNGGGKAVATAAPGTLARALDELPPQERAAVFLVDAQGIGPREASRALDLPHELLASRLGAARESLRAALGDHSPQDGIGAALRDLDTPDHLPDFHAELHRRLAAERTRPSRLRHLGWPVRIAAIAAAAAIAFVGFQALRAWNEDSTSGAQPAGAAGVKTSVERAFAESRALSGTFVSRERDPESGDIDTASGTFLLLDDGSFLVRTGGVVEAYDAERRISTLYDPNPGFEPVANRARRLASGPPDASVETSFQRELGSVVRALLAAPSTPVEQEVLLGRPVWTLSTPVRGDLPAGEGPAPDRLTVSVDRGTGVPLYASWTAGGELVRELNVNEVEVDAAVSRSNIAVEMPDGVAVSRSNRRFERVDLAEVAGVVGYRPLVPGWTPQGYELADVTVARRAGRTGAEGGNPRSRGVVSLVYRRGLGRIVVTTRLAGESEWSDPLAEGDGFVAEPEAVALERGALSGVEANLLIVPLAIPHIWAQTDELVVTVAGDLDRAGLVRVAESLEARS